MSTEESTLPTSRSQQSLFAKSTFAILAVLIALTVLALAFGTFTGPSLEAQPLEIRGPVALNALSESDCYSFPLMSKGSGLLKETDMPAMQGWTPSGVFFNGRFLLVDSTFDRLSEFSVGQYVGEYQVDLPQGTKDRVELVDPFFVYPRPGGGYLLSDLLDDSDSRMLFVDEHGQVEYEMDTWERELHDKYNDRTAVLIDVVRGVPMHRGIMAIAAFYDKESPDRKWDSFVYLDRREDSYYPLEFADGLLTENLHDLRENFYSRELVLMAVVDDVGYILVPEQRPWIAKVEVGYPKVGQPEIQRLAYLPSEYTVPAIGAQPRFHAHHEAVEWMLGLYRKIEDSSMPAGLYTWAGRLYVLLKTAADERNGHTKWYLREVSKENGSLADPIELPTRAQNLAFVLGEDAVGFIEKGGIDILDSSPLMALYRPARSAKVLPVSWLSKPDLQKQTCLRVAVGH